MSFQSINFSVPKMQQTAESWAAANIEMGPDKPLKVKGGYTLAMFVKDQENAVKAINGVPGLATSARLAMANEITCKTAAKVRLFQFGNELLAQVPDSTYATMIP